MPPDVITTSWLVAFPDGDTVPPAFTFAFAINV
jgi:hypothetical protein